MLKQLFSIIALFFGLVANIAAQTTNSENQTEEEYSKLPSIGIGGGTLSYFGDLNKNSNVGISSQVRSGLSISIEERFNNFIGLQVSGLYGKLSYIERSKTRNLNFETPITQGSLNFVFYFDNNAILKRSTLFSPFISAGIGFMSFTPKGDLKDSKGNEYFYWKDGSIKDLPENDINKHIAVPIKMDYEYETNLTSTVNYSKNSVSFPLTLGFKLKLGKKVETNIFGTYYISNTDYLDNVKDDSKNDNYLYTGISLNYNFGTSKAKKEDDSFKNIDYKSLDKLDSDGDGVADLEDICQNTPPNTKVDSKGCPEDSDHDGVPNYVDKEPNSSKGAIVGSDGVTLTDAMIAEKMARDSIAVGRNDMFNQNPSLLTLRQMEQRGIKNKNEKVESPYISAPEFKIADTNKDGYLSVDEIMNAIDLFFEGQTDLNVERINKLIDYFFEQ